MHRSHSHNNRVQCQAHQASPPLTLEPYITRHYYQFRRNLELNQLIKSLPLLEEQEFWQLELNVRADLEISCMRGIDFLLTEVKRMIIVRQVLPVLLESSLNSLPTLSCPLEALLSGQRVIPHYL